MLQNRIVKALTKKSMGMEKRISAKHLTARQFGTRSKSSRDAMPMDYQKQLAPRPVVLNKKKYIQTKRSYPSPYKEFGLAPWRMERRRARTANDAGGFSSRTRMRRGPLVDGSGRS